MSLSVVVLSHSIIQIGLQASGDLNCEVQEQILNCANIESILNKIVDGSVSCTKGYLGVADSAIQFGGTPSDYITLPNNSLPKPTEALTV